MLKKIFVIKSLLLIIIVLLSYSFVKSDDNLLDDIDNTKDTVYCYKYHFEVGDTLIYRAESYDSVIVDFGEPLLKQRYEEYTITCDSIINGFYYLTYSLTNYIGFESSGDIKSVQRTNSPWFGRKILIVMDSLGNRYKLGYDDNSHAALCPGGAFQPPLLIKLSDSISCRKLNAFWNVESLDELAENGFPVPLIRQASLMRITGTIDTLGKSCIRINSIKTAQGSYSAISGQDSIKVTNIIAGAETIDLDTNNYRIVHMLTTVEQKLTIKIGNEEAKKGLHYIFTHYTLIDEKNRRKKK